MDFRKNQLFKTELCRNFQEMGSCRYADKCRFAHGFSELRCVQRHAKYKTESCKTFHLTGTCSYGVRCTFIHDEQITCSPSISSESISPNFSVSTPNTTQFSLFGESEFNMWHPSPLAKWDSSPSIFALFNRRCSSSSFSSASVTSLTYF